MTASIDDLFEAVLELPNPNAAKRFNQLIGLDDVKQHLVKEARILINPHLLEEWSKRHYKGKIPLVSAFEDRSSLFVFAGDVGTGKTELAETFGDQIARLENISVTLYRLSISTRGTGAVGEMTKLISMAFREVTEATRHAASKNGKPKAAVILLIDEADALAQSRELDQMHHEDRAGVNTLIRGVNDLAIGRLPALVVMCTNRLEAIDPAVRRRAAEVFEFQRPNEGHKTAILRPSLEGTGLSEDQILSLVEATGPIGDRSYGYSFSDLVQRLLPAILLDAFPDQPIRYERALEITKSMVPTPPFKGGQVQR